MNKSEIRVGESYVVGGHAMGRAMVMKLPVPHQYRARMYQVDVEYPDASPTLSEHRRKTTVPTKDVLRKWTEEDQKIFERMAQRIEDQRGWQEELYAAGYDGSVHVNGSNGHMQLTFKGRAAELVLEKLTGHEIPEDKKGEYV